MPAAHRLAFVQLDVFASRPLEGNPLAVFLDARGLSGGQMQAIAREMNLSETTFILPRDAAEERERGTRVRIFTVQEELPFAGHPTLGTAAVIRGNSRAEQVWLDLDVGKIPVDFTESPEAGAASGARFGEMLQRDPEFGATHDREAVAALAGLAVDDLASDVPIQTVSTGVAFAIAPVRTLAAMRRLQLNLALAAQYGERSDAKFFYFVCRETEDAAARLHARMLFYNGEDPATGSAAGCCAAWIVAHGVVAPDERVLIEQGIEMQRPSRIFVRAGKSAGRVERVRVGGYALEVARGELFF
jgi:trans-2,3-dihydro-3-hydroxyanthranilate isomerase